MKTDRVTLFYGGIYGELEILLHRRVSIPFIANIGFVPPRLPIRFDGETVASFGMPFIEISLALRVHFIFK